MKRSIVVAVFFLMLALTLVGQKRLVADGNPAPPFPPKVWLADGNPAPPFPPAWLTADGNPAPPFPPLRLIVSA
jgi:hypothetical protein